MAVNSESTNQEIEKQKEKEIGKQKDGSLVTAENDWCLNFVSNLPWADTNNALRKSGPWMTKSEIEGTHAASFMNYETEAPYISTSTSTAPYSEVSGENIDDFIKLKWVKI